jgi:TM2 domain-containing membrane protein YozV
MKKLSKHQEVSMDDYLALRKELIETKKAYGIKEEEGKISKFISKCIDKKENRQKIFLDKKTYMRLMIFTGWMGGHHFYEKRYVLAVIHLLLCWSGYPLAMTMIDILATFPKQVNENGQILV